MKIENFGEWKPIINKIRSVAIKNGLNAYIVGGFVRDLILGWRSPKDLDIMVDGEGAGMRLAQLLHETYGGHEPILFPRFGTAKLTMNGKDVEFVAPRKEVYEKDNRKPTVERGSLYDDAIRRDFSVNALFIDLNNYEVMDLTGNGLKDLQNRTLRVADPENPDIIMQNDPLRMLRLIRQSSQLGFDIDPKTYESAKRNASKLQTISKERIQDEFNKILMTDKPSWALKLLKDSGLLKEISPYLDNLQNVEEEASKESKDVWGHTLQVVDNSPKILELRLAALFHDISKPETKSKTFQVECDKCKEKFEFDYRGESEAIKLTCPVCNYEQYFKDETELKRRHPEYAVHFLQHERIGASTVKKILRDLRYPEDVTNKVSKLVEFHMRPHFYDPETWTDSSVRRLQREYGDDINELIDLVQSDITTKYPEKRKRELEKLKHLRERTKQLEEQMSSAKIESPLDGIEIMKMYPDKKPGPWISKIKNFLLNEVIEGRMAQEDKEGAKRLLEKTDINTIKEASIKISFREIG